MTYTVRIFLLFLLQFFCPLYCSYLNTTFGNNGLGYVTKLIGTSTQINSIKLQPDGKILVGGSAAQSRNTIFLARYNTDGSPDITFGSSGIVTQQIIASSTSRQTINGIGLQSDGKIIITGRVFDSGINTKIFIARFFASGALDTTYGTNGINTTNIGDGASGNALAVQSDNKAVIAISTIINGISYFAVARYTTAGALDTTFNTTGIVTTTFGNRGIFANTLGIDTANNILVAGGGGQNVNQFIIARYTTAGTLDTSFGINGITATTIGNNAMIQSLGFQANGSIVVGGISDNKFALCRYTTNGILDSSFGSYGITLTPLNSNAQINSLALQADDKIVVGGFTLADKNKIAMARYWPSGLLDTTFGLSGVAQIEISSEDVIQSIALQTDNKIIAGGYSLFNTDTNDNISQALLLRCKQNNTDSISISNPANQSSHYTSILNALSGSASSLNGVVKLYIDGTLFATVTANNTGAWSASATSFLSNGSHNIIAQLLDSNNTVITDCQNYFIIDTDASYTMGNVLKVDKIYGNDATGTRHGFPFATIMGAMAKAQAGDTIHVYPGMYDEKITFVDGIALCGMNIATCKIRQQNVIQATDLITMATNNSLEDFTLELTSTCHVKLRGIVFPNTSTLTSQVRTVHINVDNAAASNSGTSDVYGIHANGIGQPAQSVATMRESTLIVKSAGQGKKRGILVDSANSFHVRDSAVSVTQTGLQSNTIGKYIGVETNHPNALFSARTSSFEGTATTPTDGADISQTQGTLYLEASELANATANNIAFASNFNPLLLIFSDASIMPNGTRFLRPGSGSATTNEVKVRISSKQIFKDISVRCLTAPGIWQGTPLVDTYTVRKNGTDTSMSLALTGTQTFNVKNDISVSFQPGDDVSVKAVTANNSSTGDLVVVLSGY